MTSTLTKFLTDRKKQLEQRKIMVPKYLERPHDFLGKKDFSVEDIARIELEIKECDAALKAVKRIKKKTKNKFKLNQIMKELKDCLNFYLGCEVMTNEGKGTLMSVGLYDKVWDVKISLVDGDNECIEWFKPILYPLSAINKPYPFKFHKNTVIPLEYVSTSKADSQQIMRRIENNQSIDVFEFWKIKRLLELRFDIFNLIESGLAIDKTTLK